jgi:peptidoglycan/xylan/chitin deacetylase (PgdA/CDA1 family)
MAQYVSVLKTIKRSTLAAVHGAGLMSVARESDWRGRRLLILGYHGVSSCDEHEWDNQLYIPPTFLRRRFEALQRGGYRVLPLGEAIARLYQGTLPARAVAITFDDGAVDFYTQALPILEQFGFPATVYLTSYYSRLQRPVFNTMLRYLLWKARERTLSTAGLSDQEETITLADAAERERAFGILARACAARGLSGSAKDDILNEVARRLQLDYADLSRRRVLQLMSPDEVGRLPRALIDVQLHTHRHRVPVEANAFEREIVDNRREIVSMTAGPVDSVRHFCYPSGVTNPSFPGWLKRLGVTSATTCFPGLASTGSDPLMLPRLIDTMNLSDVEFEGWLTGTSAFLPRRRVQAVVPV